MTDISWLRSVHSGRRRLNRGAASAHRLRRPLAVMIGTSITLGALLWPSAGWAQRRIDLPIEAALETPRVELNLTDARVVITIDPSRPARFSARAADPGIEGDVSLEGAISPRAVTQVWRNVGEGDLPVIVVEINLDPEQVLVVTGKRLDLGISISDSTTEPEPAVDPNAAADDGAAGADNSISQSNPEETLSGISIHVEDSTLRATGLQDLNLAATRSIVDLDFTGGSTEIDLDECEVHVRSLSGSSTLHAVSSELTLEDVQASVSADLEGGHLTATGGDLNLKGKVSNTGISLVSLTGSVQLNGSDTSIRITDGQNLPVQLNGQDLDILLDDVGGPIKADLVGGRIQADTIGSRFDLQLAAGAEGDLRNLADDLTVILNDGATASVNRVVGHARIKLNDSELEISNLKSLDLRARGGILTGTDIRNLTHVEIVDTELDITLPGIQGNHDILLQGSTTAVVRLPTPCRVVAKMPDTTDGDQLRVSGCLLDFDGSAKRGMQRGIDGQPPIRLNATLDEFATLEVYGLQ